MASTSGSPATPCTPEWSKSLSRELEDVINRQNMLTSRTRRRVLVSLQANSRQEEDEEMKTLRVKAIDEIINSEKSYLSKLEIVEEYFMKPIQESEFLPNQVFAVIFGDILGIRQVNKELLTSMEQSTEEIGKVFLKLAPYLKFYSTYANDFESAVKLVEEWIEKHKGFRTLISNQESRPEVAQKLNALLITPVQRIPRYKLLLDDIIKNTPRFHPDKTNLEAARTQIDAIAWHINDQIREHDNNQLLVSIQRSLVGGLPRIIKPGRKLVRHGNLMKVNRSGGGHAQPRHFVLMTDLMMYCKIKSGVPTTADGRLELPRADALEVCCVLPLKHTSVEHVVGKGVFTIKCQKEELVVYTTNKNGDGDANWVEDIQRTIAQLKKNSASLKRESNKFEPMRKPDILKLRRESLSKIMLMRNSGENARAELKANTRTKSPIRTALSPRKRRQQPKTGGTDPENSNSSTSGGTSSGGSDGGDVYTSPNKLKKIVESPSTITAKPSACPKSGKPANRAASTSAAVRRTPPRRAKENVATTTSSSAIEQTRRGTKEGKTKVRPLDEEDTTDTSVVLRTKTKTSFRSQPRNSLRSLSLRRTSKLREVSPPKPIFRSPSIYDEPKSILLTEEDTMTTYLSGKIVPLTPSARPTNVEHLVKREQQSPPLSQGVEEIYPVSLPEKKSYCTIS